MAFAVWISGLPGSGKTTISLELKKKLAADGVVVEHLRLDEFRKELVPDPKFSDAERELVYSKLIDISSDMLKEGKSIIIDATAHKRSWRDLARRTLGRLLEVYVKCGLDTCIKRESERKGGLVTADMYKKAMERKGRGKGYEVKGLGEVVGVDVPFEEGGADIIVESDRMSAKEAARTIFQNLKKGGYVK